MHELKRGLWHWTAAHPQWTLGQPWPHEVSSYAIDDGSRLLLQDGRYYAAGDDLGLGIEVFPGREHNDVALWLERAGAVIAGDTLVDFGRGLQIADWLREKVTRAQVADGLCPLLELPVEVVLPAHGPPADRVALERALLAV